MLHIPFIFCSHWNSLSTWLENPRKPFSITKKYSKIKQYLFLFSKKIHDESTVKVLNSLRMGNRHDCVLLKNSKENQILLKIVEPFVCFGYPTVGTVRELIFKKGFAFMGGRKIPIQSNKLIEDNLGQHGVICLEDVIHELSSVGEKFDFVVKFLSPFQVSFFNHFLESEILYNWNFSWALQGQVGKIRLVSVTSGEASMETEEKKLILWLPTACKTGYFFLDFFRINVNNF